VRTFSRGSQECGLKSIGPRGAFIGGSCILAKSTLQQVCTDCGLRQILVRVAHMFFLLPRDYFLVVSVSVIPLRFSRDVSLTCHYTLLCLWTLKNSDDYYTSPTADNHAMIQLRASGPGYGAWAWAVNSRFEETMATYQDEKASVAGKPGGSEVLEALASIGAIANECKDQGLDGATFQERSQEQFDIVVRNRSLYRRTQVMYDKYLKKQFLRDLNGVIMIESSREPLSSVEVPLDLTDGLSERFNDLSWNNGVAVGKGMTSQESESFLHELCEPVSGWYLQIRVTQHRDEDDEDGEEVQPLYVEDRHTYPVEDEIIRVRIRNIALAAPSRVYPNPEFIDEHLLHEELVIKMFNDADTEIEAGSAKLNWEIKEVERTLEPGTICECRDNETQTCVLRIEIERKK